MDGRSQSRLGAAWWLTLAGSAVCVCLFLLGAYVIYASRQDAWNSASRAADNLSVSLERDIARSIEVYDLSLQGVGKVLALPGIDAIDPQIRQSALFDSAAAAEHLGAMLVLDATGNIRYDSHGWPARTVNYADREYFIQQRANRGLGLYISRPVISHMTGLPQIVLSRRLERPDGGFDGIVLGTMELSYFEKLFRHLDLGPHGAISVLTLDGHIISRQPYRPQDIDLDISHGPNFPTFRDNQSGSTVKVAAVDGVRRLFSYRHIGNLPMILAVGVAVEDVYGPWRNRAGLIGGILLSLCIATFLSGMSIRHELRLRLAAEGKLKSAADEAAKLARIDGLTGLANRREMDRMLDEEWRRARRCGHPVSLLLIDVDHFKIFNDSYGHLGGDAALRSVSACIGGVALRSGDFAARYGGEEFALILPDTDRLGAEKIGTRLRDAVANLGIPHAGSGLGKVTISVGVATTAPMVATDDVSTVLLERADAALYAAKHDGRNRAVCAQDDDDPAPWPPLAALQQVKFVST